MQRCKLINQTFLSRIYNDTISSFFFMNKYFTHHENLSILKKRAKIAREDDLNEFIMKRKSFFDQNDVKSVTNLIWRNILLNFYRKSCLN